MELPGDFSLLRWLGCGLVLHLFMSMFIYPFFISPVRHVPGPWYARVSKLPLQYATFKRRRSEYATNLLNQYGPIVVIAPNQIHTTDEAAMKIIYDKTSLKTNFYASMGSWKGVTSTLGFVDYKSASPSRNNLIQCFQNRNLATLVESIESHIDEFIDLIDSSVKANTLVDGVVAFRFLALDIVTDVLWGEKETLLSQTSLAAEETPAFLRRFHAFSTWNAMKSFIPAAEFIVKYFGSAKWRALRKDCDDMDVLARDALERWKQGKMHTERQKDVLSMIQSMNSPHTPVVPTDDIPAYMVEMLAAGSSTTSHTAAFACAMLTRHPDIQAQLHEELTATFPDPENIDIKMTIDLPCLDGVIRETMRLFPMIPGPLERYLGKDVVVDGKIVPKGVIASTAAYNQGRLEDVYSQANDWRPERWLDATERMKTNWTPFGYGCRACPGSNLAMTELKYMLGKIFRLFEVVAPPGHENDILELADIFAAGSKTGHCWLKFQRLGGDEVQL